MPELPEVETVKRVLETQIKGLYINHVTVRRPEVVAHPSAEEFCALLTGQHISNMMRRGKFLGVSLDSGDYFVLHLRMTGGLLFTPPDYPEEKHTHIIFKMSNGYELRFSDPRRFGRFWFLQKGETDTHSGIAKLGLEPFDKNMTADYLQTHFGKRKKTIKECLLEQNVIAGIGNIYSDEILFTAGIYPGRRADSLTKHEWQCLAAVIPERLSYFINKNKISPEDYLQSKGKDYHNTPFLQVYGHNGKQCPKCLESFCRTVIGGRSSVYCPSCQSHEKEGRYYENCR